MKTFSMMRTKEGHQLMWTIISIENGKMESYESYLDADQDRASERCREYNALEQL
jgi:hypothetical protein